MSKEQNRTAEISTKGLVITHSFDAPRDLVYKAFTEYEWLQRWWGPIGFKFKKASIDLKPGGIFHYCMAAPNGQEMWGKWVIKEVNAPTKFSFVSSFSDENLATLRHPLAETWPLETLSTINLVEQGGKTMIALTAEAINANAEEQKTFKEGSASMEKALKASLDRLEEELAKG